MNPHIKTNPFGPWDGNYLCRFHEWAYAEGRWPYRQYVCRRCGEICMPAVVGPRFTNDRREVQT